MRVTIVQEEPLLGNIEYNIDLLSKALERATIDHSELVITSELFLSGYPPQDLLHNASFLKRVEDGIQKVLLMSVAYPTIGIIIGAPIINNKTNGIGVFNSLLLIENGVIQATHRKVLLPTYDVFDDTRYFDSGDLFSIVSFHNYQIALTICEDVWINEPGITTSHRYQNEIVRYLPKAPRIDVLVNIAASPFYVHKQNVRKEVLKHIAQSVKAPVIFVNQIGAHDELLFDGGSLLMSATGAVLVELPLFERTTQSISLSDTGGECAPLKKEEVIDRALTFGLRSYFRKTNFTEAVLGLSGGIDSAVVAVLAAQTLRASNIHAIGLPSVFSSHGSITDAQQLAQNIGIKFLTEPISPIFEQTKKSVSSLFPHTGDPIAEENLQARIRGSILMTIANRYHWLVLATGNKSEVATGYTTLYGDMCGALMPIGDLYKTEVYQYAQWLNRESNIIPESILSKAPSAELRPEQRDEDSLPPYTILDEILFLLIEKGHAVAEIVNAGYEKQTVINILHMLERAEFKRHQAPPILKITEKAFGMGRRFFITSPQQ